MSALEIRFRQFLVQCPARPYDSPEKIEVKFVKTDEYGWFPAPCDGCNSMNGLMPCNKCCAAINLLLMRHPDLNATHPIHPDISSLQIATAEERLRILALLSDSNPPEHEGPLTTPSAPGPAQ